MSGNDFQIELEEFRKHVPRFEELSKELETEVRQLVSDVGALFGKVGDDDLGTAFSDNYLPMAQKAVEEFGKVVKNLSGLSTNTATVANSLESVDESLSEALTKMKSVMDGGRSNR
ncbi:hypothetical protein [Nocardia miyunensis]|uniref:hypothetical protein n=1 Tax=Nocardia miyunensis TaxID=282684 RepID=UPI00082BE445|nr:hypothetical protein [Nocardia miyunensis]